MVRQQTKDELRLSVMFPNMKLSGNWWKMASSALHRLKAAWSLPFTELWLHNSRQRKWARRESWGISKARQPECRAWKLPWFLKSDYPLSSIRCCESNQIIRLQPLWEVVPFTHKCYYGWWQWWWWWWWCLQWIGSPYLKLSASKRPKLFS